MKRVGLPRKLSQDNAFDRKTLEAFRAAVGRYASKPWVVGVTIGIRERKGQLHAAVGPVIAIHVKRKLRRVPRSQKIPRFILGIPTDVVAGTYKSAESVGAIAQGPSFPLRPGASIGRANGTAASLGGIVRDEVGVRHILCAGHTLREGGQFAVGDPIVHPGPADAGGQSVLVARFVRVHLGMDAGLARLEANIAANNIAHTSNVTIQAPQFPVVGDTLEKSGRTTGVTQGIVQGIGTFELLFPVAFLRPVDGDSSPISLEGDSGSMWYDAVTDTAKGLHVAVDPNTGRAIATLAQSIVGALKVTWE